MSEYVTGQIYGWNGGECPVHPDTKITAWFRGVGCLIDYKADHLQWAHDNDVDDIVCFQVVTPYVEPKVIWIVRDIRGKGSEILYGGDREDVARRTAGIAPDVRLVEKYVEVKE